VSGPEQQRSSVTQFPLVEPGAPETVALIAIVRRLSIARSIGEVMEIVTHAARTLLGADGITFVLREGDLCHYAEEDAISPLWKGRRFPMSACISGWCMLERKAAVIPDIYQDGRIPHEAYRPTFVRSLAMVPVRQDDPIAAMGAYWAKTREISAAEVELLQSVANAAALAVAYVDLQAGRHRAGPRDWLAPKLHLLSELGWRRSRSAASPGPQGADAASRASKWTKRLGDNSAEAFAFATLCVALAAAARFALGYLVDGEIVPFATFYPVVLVATLAGAVGPGLLALVLGGVVGAWAFSAPPFAFAFNDPPQLFSVFLYAASGAIIIFAAARYRNLVRILDSKESERRLLTQELQHRVRNTLAVVQAVVGRELRDDKERAEGITRRIAALATAEGLFESEQRPVRDLNSVLLAELTPYGAGRFALAGENVRLASGAAKALSLVVHELATNAAKHGALSVPEGRVAVSWTMRASEVNLFWQESDGPPLARNRRRGFGTHFMERMLASIGGSIDTEYPKTGIVHRLRFDCAIAPEEVER
jgi:two-component sensor histidine kinase